MTHASDLLRRVCAAGSFAVDKPPVLRPGPVVRPAVPPARPSVLSEVLRRHDQAAAHAGHGHYISSPEGQ